jgi:antitoxin (DNA-binding transcriptional repressor) of toxin-antitoxin stability system
MKTIGAAKFKEQCLSIIDHLEPSGIVITKHGKPVAKLLPVDGTSKDLIGCMRGRVKIKGDVMSTGVRWSANAKS